MIPKVVLVRHGHTSLNGSDNGQSPDRIRGWKDVPLNEVGKKDAEKAAKELQKKYSIEYMYSSDLSRAFDTAKICNKDGVPVVMTKDLRPWNLGIYQGQETKKILDELIDHVKNEKKKVKDGESFKEFRERFLSCLNGIIDQAIDERIQIAVFTHYRDLKCADAWIAAGFPVDLSIDVDVMLKDDFEPGELFEIPVDSFISEENEEE